MAYSKIVVSADIDGALQEMIASLDRNTTRVFRPEKEEFLLSDADAVIEEAYIAESSEKTIILVAPIFSVIVQNRLLKILEEPPKNIVFILIVPSKNVLLPTIRSRLPLEMIKREKESVELALDMRRLDIKAIYEFAQTIQNHTKSEVKGIIEAIFMETLKSGIPLSEEEMQMFQKAIALCELNANRKNLIVTLLLMIYNKKVKKR
jgi:DNA polymerase-3 subunit delta'